MIEPKRYSLKKHNMTGECYMEEDVNGEWLKNDDIEKLFTDVKKELIRIVGKDIVD